MSPTYSARTKTGCRISRSTCSPKMAAFGSTVSARTGCLPSPKTASTTCARSSQINEPPESRRPRSRRSSLPCGPHRMLTPLRQARHFCQHYPDAAAAKVARTQSSRKHLAVHPRQLALQPRLQLLRRHPRALLPCLEQARRSALDHHIDRPEVDPGNETDG